MNPLTNVKNLNKLNEREIQMGVVGTGSSWHKQYRHSAWIFFGGISFELTDGDIICIFSQYGEIVNINLVRDKKTGKSKGYGFICYEDQRSTDLAVDNFNGITLLGRTLRVDHVNNYKPPKDDENEEDIVANFLKEKGCAPDVIEDKLKKLKDNKYNFGEDDFSRHSRNRRDRSRSQENRKTKINVESDDDLDIVRQRRPGGDTGREKKIENNRSKSPLNRFETVKIKSEPKSEEDEDNARRKERDSNKTEKYKDKSRSVDNMRQNSHIKKEYNSDKYKKHLYNHKRSRTRSRSPSRRTHKHGHRSRDRH